MNKIEDFENAPVGATASSAETNARYVKNSDDRWLLFDGLGHLLVEKYHLQSESFKLDRPAPTTAREALALAFPRERLGEPRPIKPEAFDRWLEQVKQEARAEAWEEGHHAGQHNEHEYRPERAMTNPYRQETQA